MLERMSREKILVSACLLGEKVRYDGTGCPQSDPRWLAWQQQGRLVPLCPEMAGGLDCPRVPAEILGGHVINADGADVTGPFRLGAEKALALAQEHGIRMAILKEGSPSCGHTRINDGSFSGRKISGVGITAALLEEHGIRVFSEEEIIEAAAFLNELEAQHVE
jgi:uncharacterized protein YbbK (DUF523 family)